MPEGILRRAAPEDYEDLIDFANMVFKEDFKELYPHLYEGHPELAREHYLFEEGARIKALVLCHESELWVGGRKLLLSGIGTVCTHPYTRGKGYMKNAMQAAVADSVARGADLMELSGRRRRYEHYGFTPCGMVLSMRMTESIARSYPEIDDSDLSLQRALPGELEACARLYGMLPVHVARTEDFWRQRRDLHTVYKCGKMIGYLIGERTKIAELTLEDYTDSAAVVFRFFRQTGSKSMTILLPYFQQELVAALSVFCEDRSIQADHSLNVLRYENVLRTYLELYRDKLLPGRRVYEVEEHGRFEIEVLPQAVRVAPSTSEPDRRMGHLEAMEFFFSPVGLIQPGLYTAPERSWFPLPLAVSAPDRV